MNPLVKDVAPIALSAPSADLAVGQAMDLTVSGGSGSYTFSSDNGRRGLSKRPGNSYPASPPGR